MLPIPIIIKNEIRIMFKKAVTQYWHVRNNSKNREIRTIKSLFSKNANISKFAKYNT
jgi:hypothetical protein